MLVELTLDKINDARAEQRAERLALTRGGHIVARHWLQDSARFICATAGGAVIAATAICAPVRACSASGGPVAPPAAYHIETFPAQRIEAVLTDTVTLTSGGAARWTIYAPDAPETPDQGAVFSTLSVVGQKADVNTWNELSPLGRNVWKAQLSLEPGHSSNAGHAGQVSTRETFSAILYRRSLMVGPAKEPVEPLRPDLRRSYTRASTTIDYDAPAFQTWLETNGLRRAAGERDLVFAFRVFKFVRKHYDYAYSVDQDRSASAICRVKQTDCGGLSQLFVASLRACGVPATALCGRFAQSASGDNSSNHGNCHVKAQFYADGIGWVPVEMSGATCDKSAPDWIYFGRTMGDFLTLSVDNDEVLLSSADSQQNQRGLQGVKFWVTSTTTNEYGAPASCATGLDPRAGSSNLASNWEVRCFPVASASSQTRLAAMLAPSPRKQ